MDSLSTRISKVNELVIRLNRERSVEPMIQVLNRNLKWLFSYSYLSLTLVRESGRLENYVLGAEQPYHEPVEGGVDAIPDSTVFKAEGSIRNPDEPKYKFLEEYPNLIVLPMIGEEGRKWGSLNIAHRKKGYDDDDIRIAYMLGIQLTSSLAKIDYLNELRRLNAELEEQQTKNEMLLANTLPKSIIRELKANGNVQAVTHPSASIMFTDFVGFADQAYKKSPNEIINILNNFFSTYDEIVKNHGLEKLKTIGDSYMCAAGVPQPMEDHALKTVRAALEIREATRRLNQEMPQLDEPSWEIRIGINSGPVVAGIIGIERFSYDVWGNTVNIASRTESKGRVGAVNITGETFEQVKDHYDCTFIERVDPGRLPFDLYTVEPR